MSANHNGKINEALELLNNAARDKKEEILSLITNRYTDLKDAVETTKEKADEAIHAGQVRFKKATRDMNKKVSKDPWAFIGAAAGVALLLGFVLGKSSKRD